jgi:WD40 repeat protein
MSRILLATMLVLLGVGCGLRFAAPAAGGEKAKDAAPDEVRRFELPEDEVVDCVAFSPNGRNVIAGTAGGWVWLWDTAKGKAPRKLKATSDNLLTGGVMSLAFSPDGKRILLGCADHTVRLLDTETGKVIRALKGHGGPVRSVAYFKDGKRALSGSMSDYTIREWDLERGKELRRFKGEERPDSLCISADERSLVTTEGGTVRLWDLELWKPSHTLEGHDSRVHGAFFTSDGRRIISGSLGEVRVWEAKTGKSLGKFGDGDFFVESVAVSSDGGRVLLGGINELQLWDVETGKLLKRFDKARGTVRVAFSPDGRYALSGEMWGRVRLYALPKAPGKSPGDASHK